MPGLREALRLEERAGGRAPEQRHRGEADQPGQQAPGHTKRHFPEPLDNQSPGVYLQALRSEDKGQAGAWPYRARAIPCTVRAVTIQQPSTATTPDSSKHELSPTPSVSWGSDQLPSGATSSGRKANVPDLTVNGRP